MYGGDGNSNAIDSFAAKILISRLKPMANHPQIPYILDLSAAN